MPLYKVCTKCHKDKSVLEFNQETRKQYEGMGRYRAQCKACERNYSREKRRLLKDRVFQILGDKCVRCGFTDRRALQIDHVNGGGVRDIGKVRNAQKYLKRVITDTTGKYQILCANCNWIKRAENDENPTFENILKNAKAASEG